MSEEMKVEQDKPQAPEPPFPTLGVRSPEALPLPVQRQLGSLMVKLETRSMAQELWGKVLSEQEQKKLGKGFHEAVAKVGGAARMYAAAKGIPLLLAVVEAASEYGMLTPHDRRRLRDEVSACDPAVEKALNHPALPPMVATEVEEELDNVLPSKILVLVDGPTARHMYWKGKRVAVDWFAKSHSWDFLLALTTVSSSMQRLDQSSLGNEGKRLADRKANFLRAIGALSPQLRSEVAGAIKSTNGGYQWNLLRDKIYIIQAGPDGGSIEDMTIEAVQT